MPTGLGDEQLWLSATNDNTGTSTAFNDQSGNGNNGTASGTLVVADTSEGGSYAFDFDGVNDYIDISGFAANTSAYSVSCWIDGTGPNQTIVAFNSGDSSGGRAINIGLQPSGTALAGHQNGGSSYWAESTSSVNGSGWKHIACTFDGSTVEIFIDGVSEDTQAASVTDKTQALAYIGRWVGTTPFWLTGKMDDIRAYERALTQSEITHLSSQRGVEGPPPVGLGDEQLWLCPSLNDSANDISGSGNDGTYQGGMGTVADTSNGGSLAFDFDGTGDHISVSGGVGTGTTDAFCLSFWWNWAGNGTDYVWDMDYTENNALSLLTKTSPSRLQAFSRPDSDGSGNTYMGVAVNTWTHIVYQRVAGSNQIKSYVNGVEFVVARTASDPITLGNDTTIGNSIAGTSLSAFEGMMDDIRWFNKSLTQSEITHLASQRGVEGPPPVGLGDEQLWLCPSLNDSANDISGSGNDGTYNGGMGTVLSDGKLAFDFDGVDDYIQTTLTDTNWRAGNGDFTLTSWYKPKAKYNSGRCFNDGAVYFGQESNFNRVRVQGVNPIDFIHWSNPLYSSSSNPWRHFAVTFTAGGFKVYQDGVLEVEVAAGYDTTVNSQSYDARIGYVDGSSWTSGYVDDVRVFSRVLTQSEITHLATSRGIEGPPSTPTTQYNAFITHAFKQLFQTRLR